MEWEKYLSETDMTKLYWYTDEADKDIMDAIAKYYPKTGHVPDIGAGLGTMTKVFHHLGYCVTAIDISKAAIEMAKNRLGEISESITFIVDYVTDTKVEGNFDIVHDQAISMYLKVTIAGSMW